MKLFSPIRLLMPLLLWGTAICAMNHQELSQDDLERGLISAVRGNWAEKAAFYLSCGANLHAPCTPSNESAVQTLKRLLILLRTNPNEIEYRQEFEKDGGSRMVELFKSKDPHLQNDPELEIAEPASHSWGITSFLASQVDGARDLLQFGRSAGQALIVQAAAPRSTAATENDMPQVIPADDRIAKLVHYFLHNFKEYKKIAKIFPQDLQKLLAREILRDHPLNALLKEQLELRACITTFTCTPSIFNLRHFEVPFKRDDPSCLTISNSTTRYPICTLHHELTSQENLFEGICYRTIIFNHNQSKVATYTNENYDTPDHHKRRVVLWNAHPGACLHILDSHTNRILSTEFSPDGSTILTTSCDRTARIWDVDSGKCLQTLADPDVNFWFNSAHFNPKDSSRIVTAHEGSAHVWDAQSGLRILSLKNHDLSDPLLCARYNTAGNKIVTASYDKRIKIWDAITGECLYTLRGHNRPVVEAQFNPAGDKIISVDPMNESKVWNVGRLFALEKWLKSCTLEQALLLHCISVTHRFQKILSKRSRWASLLQSGPRFDFNRCPHLQDVFDSMPTELQIQDILSPYVIRCVNEESYDSESDDG